MLCAHLSPSTAGGHAPGGEQATGRDGSFAGVRGCRGSRCGGGGKEGCQLPLGVRGSPHVATRVATGGESAAARGLMSPLESRHAYVSALYGATLLVVARRRITCRLACCCAPGVAQRRGLCSPCDTPVCCACLKVFGRLVQIWKVREFFARCFGYALVAGVLLIIAGTPLSVLAPVCSCACVWARVCVSSLVGSRCAHIDVFGGGVRGGGGQEESNRDGHTDTQGAELRPYLN